jgi:hypothetical protein
MAACAPLISTQNTFVDSDLLSQESARGFDASHGGLRAGWNLVIGGKELSVAVQADLRRRVYGGECLVWEASSGFDCRRQLAQFGIETNAPRVLTERDRLYVRYEQPTIAWVRNFESVTTAASTHRLTTIATVNQEPVVVAQRFGSGRILFLGSMLGPHLVAEDPDAHAVAAALFALRSTSL